MSIDSIVVLMVVAVAAGFIARRAWRTLASARASKHARSAAGCTTCGCDGDKEPLSL